MIIIYQNLVKALCHNNIFWINPFKKNTLKTSLLIIAKVVHLKLNLMKTI